MSSAFAIELVEALQLVEREAGTHGPLCICRRQFGSCGFENRKFCRPQHHSTSSLVRGSIIQQTSINYLGETKDNRVRRAFINCRIATNNRQPTMPTFQSNKFRSTGDAGKIGTQYRRLMNKHPFVMFGLPFIAVVIAGSFVLTPATAIRYERQDRKVRQMTKEEELGVRRAARKVDMKEEYYVSPSCGPVVSYSLAMVLAMSSWSLALRMSSVFKNAREETQEI